MKTGWESMWVGSIIYFIPFFFVFNASLVMQGSGWESLYLTVTALIGTLFVCGAIQGYKKKLSYVTSLVLIVAVEPNGPPVFETEFKGAPEWFADMGAKKSSGLGEVPLTYDPPLKSGEELAFVQQGKPDAPDLVRCWQQTEPARKLPKLANIPILIIVAEASYHASYDHCTANYLTQAGVRNTMIRLESRGIRGNGHMMMLEKNSDQIAALMLEWIEKTVPPKP